MYHYVTQIYNILEQLSAKYASTLEALDQTLRLTERVGSVVSPLL